MQPFEPPAVHPPGATLEGNPWQRSVPARLGENFAQRAGGGPNVPAVASGGRATRRNVVGIGPCRDDPAGHQKEVRGRNHDAGLQVPVERCRPRDNRRAAGVVGIEGRKVGGHGIAGAEHLVTPDARQARGRTELFAFIEWPPLPFAGGHLRRIFPSSARVLRFVPRRPSSSQFHRTTRPRLRRPSRAFAQSSPAPHGLA